MKDIRDRRLGWVRMDPVGPVVAGSVGQWMLTYTAGSYGVDEGGTIMLVQRSACDWQKPQFDHPDQPGYTTVTTNAEARLSVRFQGKQHIRPWQKWCLVIDVHDGYLAPEDTVTIILGDRSRGCPGIRAQSFAESAHTFRFMVDPTNAAWPRQIPASPTFPVVAGKPEVLVCILPSETVIGDTVDIFTKAEDRWGNPSPLPGPVSLTLRGDGRGEIASSRLTALGAGTLFVHAAAGGMTGCSNPISILEKKPVYHRFWGDLHAQTASTVGTGTEAEYFAFGRDVARLDFISHQGNDFQVTEQDWTRLNKEIKKFHEPGKYVVFPGYEWSGNTSAGGDHNVIYLKDDPPIFRSSHWQIPRVPEDDRSPAHPIDQLYKRLRDNGDALLIPHVGGRFADIRKFFDPDLIPLVEIVSCWGIFEWMLWDAIENGHRVGVVCNSDGHKGRPGAEGPGAGSFGIYGGLTCVLAESLTRESIFSALKARRCYGTTGVRINLRFSAGDYPMGAFFSADKPVPITSRVTGTGPLEALYLYQGRKVIKTVRPPEFDGSGRSPMIRISWEGARIRGRARRATWDGRITVSGNRMLSAKTFAFDSPADGILTQDQERIVFKSSTTGDTDGLELMLEEKSSGLLTFDSALGGCAVDLEELGNVPKTFDFGGLGLKVTMQRYPETLQTKNLTLACTVSTAPGKTVPYLVKAVQADGHMAWSSPVYLTGRT